MTLRNRRKKRFEDDYFSKIFIRNKFFLLFEEYFFKFQAKSIIYIENVKSNIKKNQSVLPKPNLAVEIASEMSRVASFFISAVVTIIIIGITITILIFSLVWPKLPELEEITRYEPVLPMKIYTKDFEVIKEFGVERREFTPYINYPEHLIQALISAEDKRFFSHYGFDPRGIARALYQAIKTQQRPRGTSTITQQLARWFYLTQEQTIWRKVLELLLAIKIEQELTKEKILEVYMNQIYLGERSFGFSAASKTYFNKEVQEIDIAEAALLASLPKFPSVNPFTKPERVLKRRAYVLGRMLDDGYIDKEQHKIATQTQLPKKQFRQKYNVEVEADYVAEMARLYVMDIIKSQGIENYEEYAYSKGIQVITTIDKARQEYANLSLRKGLINFEITNGFKREEKKLDVNEIISKTEQELSDFLEKEFNKLPQVDLLIPAALIEVDDKNAKFYLQGGDFYTLIFKQNRKLAKYFKKSKNINPLEIGSIVRLYQKTKTAKKNKKPEISYQLTQLPQITGALVAVNPKTGEINSLVGGYDFKINKFNNAIQAWRQPGSTFKPFIYSAALDLGIGPGRIYEDVPLEIETHNGKIWKPKNYDNTYQGPMTVRQALAKSKNSVMVQVMYEINTDYVHRYLSRFGFESTRIPPVLSIALGSGEVTPWQMARAYSVFANGGYLIEPFFINQISDSNGKIYYQNNAKNQLVEEKLTIDPRNAYIMNELLKDVATYGTAAKARALKRVDVAGKTGTTNDNLDVWFCGYQPTLTTVVWMGYSQPQKIGWKATGGRWALPIWIDFMKKALKDVRTETLKRPKNIGMSGGDLTLQEFEGMDDEFDELDELLDNLPLANDDGVTPSRFDDQKYTTPEVRFY